MGASSPGYLDHGFSPKFKTVLFRSREQLKATENRTPTTVGARTTKTVRRRSLATPKLSEPVPRFNATLWAAALYARRCTS
jgi:hypothetical protein